MKSLILASLLVLVPSLAQTQTWVEERTDIRQESSTPRIDAWVSGNFTSTVGTFAWIQLDPNYAEAYAGPSITPKPWLQMGIGAGVEQTAHPLRFGSFVWAGNSRGSILFIGEAAGSGWWYKSEINIQVSNWGLGIMTERFKGTGPRIACHLPHTPFTLWSAYLFDQKGNRVLIGIRTKL